MADIRDCGVYRVTNKATGRVYIGSSATVARRIYLHKRDLRLGKHHSPLMQRAWDKYGEDAFVFDLVLVCGVSNLLIYEQTLIDFYQAANPRHGMNIAPIAGRAAVPWTVERRAAFIAARTGKPNYKNNPEAHARLMAGVHRGPEHHMYGRKHTDESKAKMSSSLTGRKVWNKGLPSEKKGVPRKAEHVASIRAARRQSASTKLNEQTAKESTLR